MWYLYVFYICISYTHMFVISSEILRPRKIMLRNLDQTKKPYTDKQICSLLFPNKVISIVQIPY